MRLEGRPYQEALPLLLWLLWRRRRALWRLWPVRLSGLTRSRCIRPLLGSRPFSSLALARAVRRSRLTRLAGALLQVVLPLRIILPLLQIVLPLSRRRALRPVRVGPTQRALFSHDLTSDGLRRVRLSHDALVARGLLRRNRQPRRGDAPARAGADGETA